MHSIFCPFYLKIAVFLPQKALRTTISVLRAERAFKITPFLPFINEPLRCFFSPIFPIPYPYFVIITNSIKKSKSGEYIFFTFLFVSFSQEIVHFVSLIFLLPSPFRSIQKTPCNPCVQRRTNIQNTFVKLDLWMV